MFRFDVMWCAWSIPQISVAGLQECSTVNATQGGRIYFSSHEPRFHGDCRGAILVGVFEHLSGRTPLIQKGMQLHSLPSIQDIVRRQRTGWIRQTRKQTDIFDEIWYQCMSNAPDDNTQNPEPTGNIVPTSFLSSTIWTYSRDGYTGEQCGHLWRDNITSIVRVSAYECCRITVSIQLVMTVSYSFSRFLTQKSWMRQNPWRIPDLIFRCEKQDLVV